MQGLAPSEIFVFEDFRLDWRGGLSLHDDTGVFAPVVIGSRALDSNLEHRELYLSGLRLPAGEETLTCLARLRTGH